MKIVPLFFVLIMGASALHAAPAKPHQPAPRKSPVIPHWKPATAAQRTAAMASIKAQLDAFKRNDWNKAVSYQSESLRHNFGSTAQFRDMMKHRYPQFANYRKAVFGGAMALGNRVQIGVTLTGQDGVKVEATYAMVKEKGIYRIASVMGGLPKGGMDPGNYI